MNLQQLVEEVNQRFQLGETQVIKEFDLAQKTLSSEAELLEESGSLSDVSSYISWALPSSYVDITKVDFYDSSDHPLYIEDLNINYEIYDGYIHFYSTTTTPLASMPSSIDSIILRYYKRPSDIETVNSTVDIDEVEYPAMQALVYERLYSQIPVTMGVAEGKEVKAIDHRSLAYWSKKYYSLKVEAKKRDNSIDSTNKDTVYYGQPGGQRFVRRTKEESISLVTIPSYSTIYTKYVRFKAVSPSTFTEVQKIGFGDLSYSMDGDDIVITSDGEFTNITWGDDIQNSAHRYVSANEFRFTPRPELNWGTTLIEIWIY